jgi:hypothetical protein
LFSAAGRCFASTGRGFRRSGRLFFPPDAVFYFRTLFATHRTLFATHRTLFFRTGRSPRIPAAVFSRRTPGPRYFLAFAHGAAVA